MTEDEAKTKWCPHVQIAGIDGLEGDNRGNGGESYKCLGSECMAWRRYPGEWEPVAKGDEGSGPVAVGVDRYIVTADFGRGPERVNYNQGGYCGLAGKP